MNEYRETYAQYRDLLREYPMAAGDVREDIDMTIKTGSEDTLAAMRGRGCISWETEMDDMARAVKLMDWLCREVEYCEKIEKRPMPCSFAGIVDLGRQYGMDSKHLAVALAEMLLAAGYPARYVTCRPMSPEDMESHTVVQAFIGSRGKWIVFDPTFHTCYLNGDEPLSLQEMRDVLAAGFTLRMSRSADGEPGEAYNLSCLVKNLFWFGTPKHMEAGVADDVAAPTMWLIPKGFDAEVWQHESSLFMIRHAEETMEEGFAKQYTLDFLRENLDEQIPLRTTLNTSAYWQSGI